MGDISLKRPGKVQLSISVITVITEKKVHVAKLAKTPIQYLLNKVLMSKRGNLKNHTNFPIDLDRTRPFFSSFFGKRATLIYSSVLCTN